MSEVEAVEGAISNWLYVAVPVLSLGIMGCLYKFYQSAIDNIIAGRMFLKNMEVRFDEPLLISGRGARLVRVEAFKTVFYMEADRFSKMTVTNVKLIDLVIEQRLTPIEGNTPAVYAERKPDE